MRLSWLLSATVLYVAAAPALAQDYPAAEYDAASSYSDEAIMQRIEQYSQSQQQMLLPEEGEGQAPMAEGDAARVGSNGERLQEIDGHMYSFNPETGIYTQLPSSTLRPDTAEAPPAGAEPAYKEEQPQQQYYRAQPPTRVISAREAGYGEYRDSRGRGQDKENSRYDDDGGNQAAYDQVMGVKPKQRPTVERWNLDKSDYARGSGGRTERYYADEEGVSVYYDQARRALGNNGRNSSRIGVSSSLGKDTGANRKAYEEMMSTINRSSGN